MSTTELQDVVQVVSQALVDSAAVSALAEGRVTSGYPASPEEGTSDYPRVVLLARGGRRQYGNPARTTIIEVWALSRGSSGEAMALYDACFQALQAEKLTVATVTPKVVCRETLAAQQGFDTNLRAHSVMGRWEARCVA